MAMTVKKLHKFGLIYIVTLAILGFWLAEPMVVGMSLFAIGINVW